MQQAEEVVEKLKLKCGRTGCKTGKAVLQTSYPVMDTHFPFVIGSRVKEFYRSTQLT